MFNMKKKSHVSVLINDYVIRALVSKGPTLDQPVIYETPLPRNVVQEGSIMDEMAMYELIKSKVPIGAAESKMSDSWCRTHLFY